MEGSVSYISFNEIGVSVAVFAIACAFVVLVWNAVKAVRDMHASARKPFEEEIEEVRKDVREHDGRIAHLEECCTEVRGKLEHDWEFQQDETEMNRLMLKSIKQLLKHSLDGNDKDGLKDMEDEIDNYLIQHTQ